MGCVKSKPDKEISDPVPTPKITAPTVAESRVDEEVDIAVATVVKEEIIDEKEEPVMEQSPLAVEEKKPVQIDEKKPSIVERVSVESDGLNEDLIGTYELKKDKWICQVHVLEDNFIRSAVLSHFGIDASRMTPEEFVQAFDKVKLPVPIDYYKSYAVIRGPSNRIFKAIEQRHRVTCVTGNLKVNTMDGPRRMIGFLSETACGAETAMTHFIQGLQKNNRLGLKSDGRLPGYVFDIQDHLIEQLKDVKVDDEMLQRFLKSCRCSHMSDVRCMVAFNALLKESIEDGCVVRNEDWTAIVGCKERQIDGVALPVVNSTN